MIPRRYFYHEEWNIGIQKKQQINTPKDIPTHLQTHSTIWLKNKFHFQADPFLVEYDDYVYVFYEAWNHTWTRGRIRCRVLDSSLNEQEDFEVEGVNRLGCHLSFPNVFLHDGSFYMIPETFEDKKVYIFQATDFPKKWTLVNTLAEGISLVDSTLIIKDPSAKEAVIKGDDADEIQDTPYKFYLVSGTHKDNQLVIHMANELTGDWVRYTGDIATADHHNRLAGATIRLNDATYLPFQERHPSEYGKSVYIKPINIDKHSWHEQAGVQILPFDEAYPAGLHTLNVTENHIVVDAKREVFQPFNFFIRKYRQLAKPIKQLFKS